MLGRIARTSSTRGLARTRTSRAAVALSVRGPQIRTLADVEVEHARGDWKTYGNLDSYQPGNYHILTFNKISPVGLQQFPSNKYDIFKGDGADGDSSGKKSNAHAILLRSHKLQEEEVPHTVRAIAR